MHEASLVQSMFDILEEEILPKDVEKVVRIQLELGTLSNAEPLLLEECFAVMKKGTIFETATFDIDNVKTEVKCLICDHVFYPETFPFLCPKCEAIGGEITSGDDIIIKKIEMEVKDG